MCHYYGITQHIFGGNKREEPSQIDPEGWAQGRRARKCLLHALEIYKLAFDIPLDYIHDTSLPGALFAAATPNCSFSLPGAPRSWYPRPLTGTWSFPVDWKKRQRYVRFRHLPNTLVHWGF